MVMANRAHGVPGAAQLEPSKTVMTGETLAVVMRNNGDEAGMSTPIHEPLRTMTTKGHQSLVIPYHRSAEASDADREPTPTLTTRDRCALLVPYKSGNAAIDIQSAPTHTMTTKDAAAVVLTEADIDDCRFRMFQLHEIAAAMAMTDHVDGSAYQVLGNKRERMAQYGNAVTPPAMELLVGRLLEVIG
jgi:DNA (cytosine-5)-methyltransferase 1